MSTRWFESVPISEASSSSCASALLLGWISRFGVPEHITFDHGTPITSLLWTSLLQLLGIALHHTTTYNPAANGMVEHVHHTLKAALMARRISPGWTTQLPWVLLGFQTSPKEGIDVCMSNL